METVGVPPDRPLDRRDRRVPMGERVPALDTSRRSSEPESRDAGGRIMPNPVGSLRKGRSCSASPTSGARSPFTRAVRLRPGGCAVSAGRPDPDVAASSTHRRSSVLADDVLGSTRDAAEVKPNRDPIRGRSWRPPVRSGTVLLLGAGGDRPFR
jgi:hypothetical protein